jgi:hypothetical protein
MVTAYVCKPEISALKQERQFLVIESQKSQNRRVNIIGVDRILDRFEPDLVRGAHGGPPHGDGRVDPNLKIRPHDKRNIGLVCRKKWRKMRPILPWICKEGEFQRGL